MENKTHAFIVGLFIVLLGLAMLFSFWWLSGTHEATKEHTITSSVPVTGLSIESTVKFRGVDVGKVTQIKLDPKEKTRILITIQIPEALPLSQKTYAELRMQGVTGLAFIDLNDTALDAPALQENDLITLQPSILDRLIEKGPALVGQIESLLEKGNATLAATQAAIEGMDIQTLNKSIANVEIASGKLPKVLDSANTTLNRFGNLASEDTQKQLVNTLGSVQKTAEAFQPLVVELDMTAKEFRSLAGDVKSKSNSLMETLHEETLPQMHALTENVNQDVVQLGEVLQLLEENPQSVLFGNPEIRPGPGETGFKTNP